MGQTPAHSMLYFLLLIPYISSASVYNLDDDDVDAYIQKKIKTLSGMKFLFLYFGVISRIQTSHYGDTFKIRSIICNSLKNW